MEGPNWCATMRQAPTHYSIFQQKNTKDVNSTVVVAPHILCVSISMSLKVRLYLIFLHGHKFKTILLS